MNKQHPPFPVTLFSFGYKYGAPQDVNLLFDVRFLSNPFHVAELRSHNGTEAVISEFVLGNSDGKMFLEQLQHTVLYYIKRLQESGKESLRVGIGCTGGHHRSVAVTEALAKSITEQGTEVSHFHRDISKESH
ncbi:MAG: hypothetical protein DSY80_10330 [Desulfocapsa sp.]|nr:MAG: hypothetical protein DSY80_10330 [Desulfocapsa sp.]